MMLRYQDHKKKEDLGLIKKKRYEKLGYGSVLKTL